MRVKWFTSPKGDGPSSRSWPCGTLTRGACTRSSRAGGPLACRGRLGGAPNGRGHAGGDCECRPRSMRSTRAPPRPLYPAISTGPLQGHPRCFCGKTGRLSDLEGRWGRMGAATVASERWVRRPSSGRDEAWRFRLARCRARNRQPQSCNGAGWGTGRLLGQRAGVISAAVAFCLAPKLDWLQQRLNLDHAPVSKMVQRLPPLFCYSVDTHLESTLNCYNNAWNWRISQSAR